MISWFVSCIFDGGGYCFAFVVSVGEMTVEFLGSEIVKFRVRANSSISYGLGFWDGIEYMTWVAGRWQ